MSRTDPTALTGALLAQRSLTRRAVQGASPAVFRVEAPATATVGAWLGLAYSHVRMPLGRKVEAEDLPAFVAIGASALAARDPDLAQVSEDGQGRLGIHFAETAETVTAASRQVVQERAELIPHHPHHPRLIAAPPPVLSKILADLTNVCGRCWYARQRPQVVRRIVSRS